MLLLLLLNKAPNPLDVLPPSFWCHCIIFLNAIPLSSRHCFVFLNIVPCIWCNNNYYSLTSLCSFCSLMMLLLLNITLVLPQCCSWFFSTMFLFDTTPPCCFCSYSSLSFLFNAAPTPRHHSYSYSMSFLLLLNATPAPCISSTFMFSFDVVATLPLDVVPTPPVSNWYFPPSYFCKCGKNKLSKFNFFKPSLKVNFFFLQMFVCWWLVPCFDYPCFFG